MRLLTPASYQTKLRKSEDKQTEYAVYSVSLSPADYAGTGKSNCPHSVPSCERACVGGYSGMAMVWPAVMAGRINKTLFWQSDREGFLEQLNREIRLAWIREEAAGRKLLVRLNAFSDIPWERYNVPQSHPDVGFYDYSKVTSRQGALPANYRICWSWSGNNGPACIELLEKGDNVAVCFAEIGDGFAGNGALRQRIPGRYRLPGSSHMWETFDGDLSDLRYLDPTATRAGYGRICALRLKSGTTEQRNAVMNDGSGFVQILK